MPPLRPPADLQWTDDDRRFLRNLHIAVPEPPARSTPPGDSNEPYAAIGVTITFAGLIGLFLSLRGAVADLLRPHAAAR